MHPLAYKYLKRVLEEKKIVGTKEDCEYYPCHFLGQDCTWCFCPFYPCEDELTGGEWVKTENGIVWGCSDCYFVHEKEVAREILEKFKIFGIDTVEDLEKRKEEVKKVFLILKEAYFSKK